MSESEEQKKKMARRLLHAEGPSQQALTALKGLGPEYGGALADSVRALGDHALGVVRDLDDLHGFRIEMTQVTGGPMPERLGLDPGAVRMEDRGEEVMVEPDRLHPLAKY